MDRRAFLKLFAAAPVMPSLLVPAAPDVVFKSMSLVLKNNVTPEKSLGRLGANFTNNGDFEYCEGLRMGETFTLNFPLQDKAEMTFGFARITKISKTTMTLDRV